jgi:isoleucyl-tRNA synthetase
MFDPVTSKVDFPALELEMMETWKRERTFQQSLDLRQGCERYVFYEGPPTANGTPGTHHILARAFKDLFGRYWTMKGRYVERKAGWDTHGLPVEVQVEKELGISGKFQIESQVGVEEFNRRCRESVYRYVKEWTAFSERMAFWQDYDDAYWTLTSDYMQSVWWALKRMWEQGLVYQGFRVAPYCPRCQTPLSSHELSQGYVDDVPDPSVFVRFRLKNDANTSLLAWTTTPWTLPGNVALAVDESVDYVRVQHSDEYLILAEARLDVLDGAYEVLERLKGADLVDLDYEPLFPYLPPSERAFYVVAADFVSTAEGTGIVHTAAAYGADDLRLCQEKGIPVRHTVDLRGRFVPEVEKFAGMQVKEADPLIIDDLRERGLLYKSETILHTYPQCWRCGTWLIYYALDSWFVRTSDRKQELIDNNAATHWVPAHIKTGRMGDWLENNVDWAISRSRYWGTPLPFWVCQECGARRCVESAADLGLGDDADLHRPYIDEVVLPCDDCSGTMRRVPEVLDTWFDSGSMPFGQRGYPRHNRELFEATFPAQFISEAIDQTRGWFYSLLAISTLLFHRNSYENVICLGHVVDPKGQKSSKSKGNVLDPNYLFETFGSDAVRWYFYTSTPVGENYRTSPPALQEVVRQFFLPLWNVYSFFVTYANIDGYQPGSAASLAQRPVLDRWLLSRLNALIMSVDRALQEYDVNAAARPIQAFVEDLSTWYVRRSRRRFWKSEADEDKLSAYQTLHHVLTTVASLLAPFAPFLADTIYRNLAGGGSVHLADFPSAREGDVDTALDAEMAAARKSVEAGLAARDAARIKVRQPLRAATLPGEPLRPEIAAIVRDELNVKELAFGGAEVRLDTAITDELRLEGLARELVRRIQDQRKRSGFEIDDRIETYYRADGELRRAIETFGDYVRAETLSVALRPAQGDGAVEPGDPAGVELQIEGEPFWLGLRRAG